MGLSLLPLSFSPILTVASRLLHPYSTNEFNGVKILPSGRHPERFPELHGEEKREKEVRGNPNEMTWNQKRREQASQ